MASCSSLFFHLLVLLILNSLHLTVEENTISLSFPLTSAPLSKPPASGAKCLSSLLMSRRSNQTKKTPPPSFDYDYKTLFKYSMALIVSLPIGTPPQSQQMILDTGSQLSWIQCHRKSPRKPPPPASFDPSLSSSFSVLPCNHPVCKPRIPDFTLPTTCDQNRLCHYSYFYADGTLAEGNLVRERFAFPGSRTTPPLILGCAAEPGEAEGILGMNLGRLSFISQAKVPRFSYCVPFRRGSEKITRMGTFYLGQNPNSHTFQYISLLTFPQSQRMPNFDPLAYTVPMVGIRIGGKKLNISAAAFRPDAGGSGQTMVDSGTQYTFLVEAAYAKVREEVVRLVGTRLKKGYVFGGALDMCFDGNPMEIGRRIGDMVFQFEKGVEISISNERVVDDVGGGVHCVAIGRSESLGIASNIIGNFHQQNHWVEFDLSRRRVGFGVADCSRSV
ncbi:Aspartic proteinase PCS1 [Sesamum angolense]|uniref:Aspartic proteinase PCS1 n=1 Tax=Sesamum angolense TaxID=2727404 RepID=A0AAE2BQI3_9LAMI|nr:Aspartic proteinase PCS1 [Sesamum angolense]